jgi:hypothetical protein
MNRHAEELCMNKVGISLQCLAFEPVAKQEEGAWGFEKIKPAGSTVFRCKC